MLFFADFDTLGFQEVSGKRTYHFSEVLLFLSLNGPPTSSGSRVGELNPL